MDASALLASLVHLSDELNESPDRAAAFLGAVHILCDTMGVPDAPSFLLDSSGTRLELVAEEHVRADLVARGLAHLSAGVHVRSPWVEPGEWPVSASDHLNTVAWAELPPSFVEWFGDFGIVTPLCADGRHLGAVLLPYRTPFSPSAEQRAYLAAAGRMLGSAIYRWKMADRERELGALEERRTLADDLHVDLSQQVATLGLRVENINLDLQVGNTPSALRETDQLRDHVHTLKRSLRNLMLGLRSDAHLLECSLVPTIERHLCSFEELIGIPTSFECDQRTAADAVPLAIAAQLVRVLQEALANARLHARPRHVAVQLSVARTRVQLQISDDGVGYHPALVPDSRLGIRIMRERIEQVGVDLTVTANPRGGTIVLAFAPLATETVPSEIAVFA